MIYYQTAYGNDFLKCPGNLSQVAPLVRGCTKWIGCFIFHMSKTNLRVSMVLHEGVFMQGKPSGILKSKSKKVILFLFSY